MRKRFWGLTAASTAALMGLSLSAFAQQAQQTVTPPRQVYWMSVTTNSGLGGMMGGGNPLDMMSSMSGDAASAQVYLQLGSADAPTRGAPEASHTVPAGARIGPQLPLRTPSRGQAPPRLPSEENDMEQPQGRMLLFFGCGERAKAGQPIVFDFARLAQGQMPAGLQSRIRSARIANFNPSAWRTYGYWPDPGAAQGALFGGRGPQPTVLPAGASLLGEHLVRGNYTPDIRFTLTQGHDVMAPVRFTSNAKTASGAVNLTWQAIPTATGYAAMAFGPGQRENDMVFWSSSDVSTWENQFDFIPPLEVARLVRERVIMAPNTTSCTVPREVLAAMKQDEDSGGMLMFNAFGPEQNVVFPQRPSDPRTPWNQQWAVKARFNSSSLQMLGRDRGAMMRGARGSDRAIPPDQQSPVAGMTKAEYCEMKRQQMESESRNAGSAIGDATGIPGAGAILGGIFGGQKKQPSVDQDCPPQR